jgi:NAD(P)-dependent dehydrogenase (short-subunit alcohol dehydrogenase family)
MLDFSGKVAFVAGAGSIGPGWGNGKASAALLARRGAKVFGTDIAAEAIRETDRRPRCDIDLRMSRFGSQLRPSLGKSGTMARGVCDARRRNR